MQSTAGTHLTETATATLRHPCCRVLVDWARAGWGNEGSWTDESARVRSVHLEQAAADVRGGIALVGNSVAGTAELVLDNHDGRFSPHNSSSPLYSYIRDGGMVGVRVRVYLGFYYGSTPEVLVQFSGHIAEPFVSAGNGTVTARLKDRAWALEHARHSTTLYMPGTPSGYSGYPDDYIGALLDLVPLADRPSTDLDRGCFPLMFAWLDDDPLWEELGRVAAVQGGMVWFDKAGTLVFRDASFFVLNATSVHTFTTARDLQESWREADIWNHVVVRWSGGRVARLAELWAQTEPLPPLRAGDSTTVQANFGTPAYAVATPVADTDYRAVRHDGTEATEDLGVSAVAYAQRVTLTLTNEGSAPLYVTKLRLRGWPVDFQDEQTTEAEDTASIATYGRRTLQVRLLYVQSKGQAEAVRDFLLHRYKEPRATYSLRVRAIPWLEVGDRVTVSISRTGHDEDFFVMGMRQDFSARGGYWQTLTLLRCADLLPYSDWFVVGTTAYGTAGRWFF